MFCFLARIARPKQSEADLIGRMNRKAAQQPAAYTAICAIGTDITDQCLLNGNIQFLLKIRWV